MKKLPLILIGIFGLLPLTGNAQNETKTETPAKPQPAGEAKPGNPFVKKKEGSESQPKDKAGPESFVNVGAMVQYIDVKHTRWQEWLSQNSVPLDATALRNEMETWITAGDAKLAEISLVMGRSGARMKVESIRQQYYPTEFSNNESGQSFPGSFERRDLGMILECDPVLLSDGSVQMNLAPERGIYRGETPPKTEIGVEEGDIRWPLFGLQKTTLTFTLDANQWGLVGCENSLNGNPEERTLIFIRPVLQRIVETSTEHLDGSEGIVTYQWVETDNKNLNTWISGNGDLSSLIGGDLYAKAIGAGATKLDEKVLRFQTGQRVKNESIKELIFAGEFTSGSDGRPSVPQANETINTGVTVEVDPVFSASGRVLDLNMAPERVESFGTSVHHRILFEGTWTEDVTMPVIYRMSPTTQVALPMDTPVLVAVMSPPDDKGVIDSSKKVLLFVKVSR
jgi:hypothetical protein